MTHTGFISQILVPKTALLLIQEDMGQTLEGSHSIMLASSQYGPAMFCEDNSLQSGVDGTSEIEKIMKQQALTWRERL
jgi:hypothetical protein